MPREAKYINTGRKEGPRLPHNFFLPEGMHPTKSQYKFLYNSYKDMYNQYDSAATSHYSMEALLITEIKLRERFQADYNKLVDLHRSLPHGSFKVPERRPPPLIVGDKNNLSPVVEEESVE